jgi:glycosyltransferase involved in cell wall biosynthesis
MTNPTISVLMSVHNGENYLEEAIESILNQTYPDFELIIINDFSTDSSFEIIKKFADKRIVLIENDHNIGLTKSLNKGLKIAKGEYIARMDADDISEINRFEKQIDVLQKNPDYTVVGSNIFLIDDTGLIIEQIKYPETTEENLGNIFFDNTIVHSSAMFRKDFVMSLGGYNEEYSKSQDYDLWLNIIENGGLLYNIQESLLKYRIHAGSISNKFGSEQEQNAIRIVRRRLKSILDIDIKESDLKVLRNKKNRNVLQKYFLFKVLYNANIAFRKNFKEFKYAQEIFFHNSISVLHDQRFQSKLRQSLKNIIS